MFWRPMLFVLTLAGPVAAQDVPSPARCRAFLASLPLLALEDPTNEVAGIAPDTCRYAGVTTTIGTRVAYRAETLVIRGVGFDPGRSNGPPETLRVEARDVATAIHTGIANTDYVLAQQRVASFDATLELAYDPSARIVTLSELSLDGLRIGRASADGEVEGVAPVPRLEDLPPNVDQVGLGRLHLHLDSRLFMAVYVLPAAMGLLPPSNSVPEAATAVRLRSAQAAAEVRDLLRAAKASDATIGAVTDFIADFPRPKHPFDISLSTPNPLRLGELGPGLDVEGAKVLARRFTVEATYAGVVR